MRFYQLIYRVRVKPTVFLNDVAIYAEGQENGIQHTEWFGSERDAVIRRVELFKTGELVGMKREQSIDPIDVPTDKAGLLAFLKANVPGEVVI